jgi:hypothetical protein
MHVRSNSFTPYSFLDARLAFGTHHATEHVALSENRNPHLAWSGVPEGTMSFALICHDPEVPTVGTDVNQEGRTVPIDLPRADFFHWVVADLPASLSEIVEGSHSEGITARGKPSGKSAHGGQQGLNDYTNWFAGDADMGGSYFGYDGPCPPWNDERVHAYVFTVFALDCSSVGLSNAFTGADLREAMSGHILARASITGLYKINPHAS